MQRWKRRICAVVATALLLTATPAAAAESPAADRVARAVFDAVLMRPFDLAALGVGAALFPVAYVVALPVGGREDIWETCLAHPTRRLLRPLGEL